MDSSQLYQHLCVRRWTPKRARRRDPGYDVSEISISTGWMFHFRSAIKIKNNIGWIKFIANCLEKPEKSEITTPRSVLPSHLLSLHGSHELSMKVRCGCTLHSKEIKFLSHNNNPLSICWSEVSNIVVLTAAGLTPDFLPSYPLSFLSSRGFDCCYCRGWWD